MTLDERLLEILACPNCRGEIEHLPDESILVCRGECGYRYPIRDGIPVLLVEEAEKPRRGVASDGPQNGGGAASDGPQNGGGTTS